MIKNLIPVLALSGLAALSACSKEEVEAKMNEVSSAASSSLDSLQKELKDLDLSALSPEAIKEKAGAVTESLTAKLGEIKDKASAADVSKAVEPLVAALTKIKGVLGDKMPDLNSLSGIAEDLKAKFGGDEGIMKVLQPMLDKLQALLK